MVPVVRELTQAGLSAQMRKTRSGRTISSFSLDVSIDIPSGITILFGPSGAGKSTLLDCIAGLLQPEEGRIATGEEVLFDSRTQVNVPVRERRVGYVFQSLALFPHLTVEENVGYGLANLSRELRAERITPILEAFRIQALRARKPAEISGGEKQRVALARSLVTFPRVLLLDEPLSGLDAELKASIIDDLRSWNTLQKIPILYVTHSRDEIDALGERVIAIVRGQIISEGIPGDVLDAPRRKKLAQSAGFENLLAGTVVDLREGDGVMRVRLRQRSCELEVPLGYAAVGDSVRLAIRAGDILLATAKPSGLSARNVIAGKLTSLEQRGPIVVAQVDCGAVFTVHVTRGAVRGLELSAGKPVWLVVKTHSCHLVDD